jgi:hypothetical protein
VGVSFVWHQGIGAGSGLEHGLVGAAEWFASTIPSNPPEL